MAKITPAKATSSVARVVQLIAKAKSEEAAMTEHVDIKQLQQNIHSVVANLRALGEVEDGH
jgi:hypothetical protein